jgi:hypothetical protein
MQAKHEALQESLRKFQSQLAQTQQLLMVVQEQRKNLQARLYHRLLTSTGFLTEFCSMWCFGYFVCAA